MKRTKRKTVKIKFWSSPIKIFVGIVALLLIVVVPFSVYYGNQQTQLNSNAAASTTLAFPQSPIQVATGSPISVDISMNPGNNAVSLIQLVVTYDASIIIPNTTTGFQPNAAVFPTVLDGPTYGNCNGNQCTMSVSLSIGSDVTKAITQQTTIATLNFQPVKDGMTQIAIDPTTQIFSLAATDQSNENVLSTSTPAVITIGQGSTTSPTSFPSATSTPSQTPTMTMIPTSSITNGITPSTLPSVTSGITGSITPSLTGTPTSSGGKICSQNNNRQCGYTSSCSQNGAQCEYNVGCRDGRSNNNVYVCKDGKWTYDHWISDGNCKFCSGNNMCGNNTVEQEKTKVENLREINETLREVKYNLLNTTSVKAPGAGGCIGSFDPNNPTSVSNCNQPGTPANNLLQAAWTNFLKLF